MLVCRALHIVFGQNQTFASGYWNAPAAPAIERINAALDEL